MATTLTPPSAPLTDTSSMLAGIGTDFFADTGSIPVPVSDDAPVDDTPAAEEPAVSEPLAEETPVAEETPAPDAPAVDATPANTDAPEEVEEGVIRTKENGKYKFRLDEGRYKTVMSNHVLAREATEAIGEPLTLDAIKLRNEAYILNERLFDHVTSGDPARQADVVNNLLSEMKQAYDSGETGVDPSIPFATTIYDSLRDQAPDAYAHLRLQAARDFLTEMYEQASSSKNKDLFSAAQQMAITLAGVGPKPEGMTNEQYAAHIRNAAGQSQIPFHTLNEMEGLVRTEDPNTALARENAELRARLDGRTTTTQTEQFGTWRQSNQQAVNKAIFEDAVQPTLASVADDWKTFPDDYKRLVVDPLNNEITNALRSDQVLIQKTRDLQARAQRATSEPKRQEIGAEIQQLYVNRAKLAADQAKAPILKSAANALKGLSVQNNDRRAAGQNRTAPNGTGTPVKHSVIPEVAQFKNGLFDSGTAMKQAMAALNNGR